MIRIALIALLALGCDTPNPNVADAGAEVCRPSPETPCCTPNRDILRDGCPNPWQSLDIGIYSAQCVSSTGYDGPFVSHDGTGVVTAYGWQSGEVMGSPPQQIMSFPFVMLQSRQSLVLKSQYWLSEQ